MNAGRDPLPYPHVRARFDHGLPAACSLPEDPDPRKLAFSVADTCPGCRAYAMAHALHDPTSTATRTSDGALLSTVAFLRESLDPFDPMMVLFERALADRIAFHVPSGETE